MAEITIRQLINPTKYRDQLKALQLSTFGKAVPFVPLDSGWWWVATVEGDVVVGFATMAPSQATKNAAYMSRCGVHKAYRGKGLQHKFINARVRFARQMGYDFIVTDTTTNPKSANNLIDHGFKTYPVSGGYTETIGWFKDLKNKKTTSSNSPRLKKT